MSLEVGTGKAGEANDLLGALERGRRDHQYFSRTFLNRELHDGQLEYVENAEATVNVLATANRWGKTTVLSHVHYHANVYKTGGEPKYLDPITGAVNHEAWLRLRYNTIHTADLAETARLVETEARKLKDENPLLSAFIRDFPLSLPVNCHFIHGARWGFRTLGHDASGIDGNSFYVASVDEAGWIPDLEEKNNNVIRIRVADVSGRIHYVGTFKPGVSKDFYKFAVRASAYTGRGLTFDHRTDDAEAVDSGLDQSIRRYLREFFARWGKPIEGELAEDLAKLGISLDEFADAATRGA